MKHKRMIQIGQKTYDPDVLTEQKIIQKMLVPDTYPGTPAEGVKLAMLTADMLTENFRRHLFTNFRKLTEVCQAEKEEQNPAQVAVSFSFVLDQSAHTVVAIAKAKFSYAAKYSTTSKAQSKDINQPELWDEDAPDTTLDSSMLNPPEPEPPKEEQTETPGDSAPAGAAEPPKSAGNKSRKKGKGKK